MHTEAHTENIPAYLHTHTQIHMLSQTWAFREYQALAGGCRDQEFVCEKTHSRALEMPKGLENVGIWNLISGMTLSREHFLSSFGAVEPEREL